MTTLEKISSLKSMVDTMSDFKNSVHERDIKMFKKYSKKCAVLIKDLQDNGVSTENHPSFKESVIKYKYFC